jgi:hypothetical protein
MDDTSPEIAAMMQKMLMARPGVERLVMGCQMFEVARTMALASMPPDLSEREIKVRLCERLYGDQVNLAAFASRLGHS